MSPKLRFVKKKINKIQNKSLPSSNRKKVYTNKSRNLRLSCDDGEDKTHFYCEQNLH
jgi:hypothetical protein